MEAILLKDVYRQMAEGKAFSLSFVKLDIGKRTGGQLVTITQALLNSAATKEPSVNANRAKGIGSSETKGKARHTVNIKVEGASHPICVHGYLITRFNSKKVLI